MHIQLLSLYYFFYSSDLHLFSVLMQRYSQHSQCLELALELSQVNIKGIRLMKVQNSNNADVLLDSRLKLSDIIANLCSKL